MVWVTERVLGNVGELRFTDIIQFKFSELTGDNFNSFWSTETSTDTVPQTITADVGGGATGWSYREQELDGASAGTVSAGGGFLTVDVTNASGTGLEGLQTTDAVNLFQGSAYQFSITAKNAVGSSPVRVLLTSDKITDASFPTLSVGTEEITYSLTDGTLYTKTLDFTAGLGQSIYISVVAVTHTDTFEFAIDSISLQQQITWTGGGAA